MSALKRSQNLGLIMEGHGAGNQAISAGHHVGDRVAKLTGMEIYSVYICTLHKPGTRRGTQRSLFQVMGFGCPSFVNPPKQKQGPSCLGLPHAGKDMTASFTRCFCLLFVFRSFLFLRTSWVQSSVRTLAYREIDVYPVLTVSSLASRTAAQGDSVHLAYVDIIWEWVTRNHQGCSYLLCSCYVYFPIGLQLTNRCLTRQQLRALRWCQWNSKLHWGTDTRQVPYRSCSVRGFVNAVCSWGAQNSARCCPWTQSTARAWQGSFP